MSNEPRIVTCRGCGARIFFIRTAKGKAHPVDAEPVRIWIPEESVIRELHPDGSEGKAVTPEWKQVDGHASHFATCPKAAQFRNRRNERRNTP